MANYGFLVMKDKIYKYTKYTNHTKYINLRNYTKIHFSYLLGILGFIFIRMALRTALQKALRQPRHRATLRAAGQHGTNRRECSRSHVNDRRDK